MKMNASRHTSLLRDILCIMRVINYSISRVLGIAVKSVYGCLISQVKQENIGMVFTKPVVGISTLHFFLPKFVSLKSMECSLTSSWCLRPSSPRDLPKIRFINSVMRIKMSLDTFSTMTFRLMRYSAQLNLNLRFSFSAWSINRRESPRRIETCVSRWWCSL